MNINKCGFCILLLISLYFATSQLKNVVFSHLPFIFLLLPHQYSCNVATSNTFWLAVPLFRYFPILSANYWVSICIRIACEKHPVVWKYIYLYIYVIKIIYFYFLQTRVTRYGREERNFHIFYQLIAGADIHTLSKLYNLPADIHTLSKLYYLPTDSRSCK